MLLSPLLVYSALCPILVLLTLVRVCLYGVVCRSIVLRLC